VRAEVTGTVRLHDPIWGDLRVITSQLLQDDAPNELHLRVTDRTGKLRLRRDWTWGSGVLGPNSPSTDASGNVFLRYNPGRHNGLIVLRGAGGRLEDFGTLPPGGDDYYGTGPFGYGADTQKSSESGGLLLIRQRDLDCDPSCAEGTYIVQMYSWHGDRYVKKGAARREYWNGSTPKPTRGSRTLHCPRASEAATGR
jgi:hypothetical protein